MYAERATFAHRGHAFANYTLKRSDAVLLLGVEGEVLGQGKVTAVWPSLNSACVLPDTPLHAKPGDQTCGAQTRPAIIFTLQNGHRTLGSCRGELDGIIRAVPTAVYGDWHAAFEPVDAFIAMLLGHTDFAVGKTISIGAIDRIMRIHMQSELQGTAPIAGTAIALLILEGIVEPCFGWGADGTLGLSALRRVR